jgi:hypothetical protein
MERHTTDRRNLEVAGQRSYTAQAGAEASAQSGAITPALLKRPAAFKIEVRFLGGLNAAQESAFKRAADRWSKVIVEGLPSVVVDGEQIDDILILAEGKSIDSVEGILGQAGPTKLRPKAAGPHAYLPAKGQMSFDSADLAELERDGSLVDVIAHEMGHVLGFGTIWARKRLLVGATSGNPTFNGKHAKAAYGQLRSTAPKPVPVENLGDAGTRNSHWREAIFANELMSGFVTAANNPLSALTVASLADLGYVVDLAAAEPYELPAEVSLAAARPADALSRLRIMPCIPSVLPDAALV